jgi:hypothetical protein
LRNVLESTLRDDAYFSTVFWTFGNVEESQGFVGNEMDQEVGGSSPPSCTSFNQKFQYVMAKPVRTSNNGRAQRTPCGPGQLKFGPGAEVAFSSRSRFGKTIEIWERSSALDCATDDRNFAGHASPLAPSRAHFSLMANIAKTNCRSLKYSAMQAFSGGPNSGMNGAADRVRRFL